MQINYAKFDKESSKSSVIAFTYNPDMESIKNVKPVIQGNDIVISNYIFKNAIERSDKNHTLVACDKTNNEIVLSWEVINET